MQPEFYTSNFDNRCYRCGQTHIPILYSVTFSVSVKAMVLIGSHLYRTAFSISMKLQKIIQY